MSTTAQRTPRSGRQSLFFQDLASPVNARRGKFSSPGQSGASSSLWRENYGNSDLPPPPVFTLEDRSDFSPESGILDYQISPETKSDNKTPIQTPNREFSTPAKGKSEASTSYALRGVQQNQQGSLSLNWWSSPAKSGGEQDEKGRSSPVEGVVQPGALITLPPPPEVARPEVQRNSLPAGNLNEEEWVTVYGFSPNDTNLVLREFEKCGEILKHVSAQILLSTTPTTNLPDPFSDLSQYFKSLSIPLTPLEASLILKSLKNPTLAFKFFHFCPSLKNDPFIYNRLFLILSRSNSPLKFEQTESLLDDMEKRGVKGSISTVNILIGFFGDLDRCVGLVKKWELRFNAYSYKCLLQGYLRLRDCDKAFGVYLDMCRCGYVLDIFAFNMLLDALAKDNKVDKAYKVFEDMKRRHCEPDTFTYTIMIRMTGKAGKTDESLALFQVMLEKGFTPNLIAYNTMIEALAKGRMADKAVLLFSKMVENGCQPNEFTYSVLLNVLVAEGQLNKLDNIVEMSKKYMNKQIYGYFVRTLSKLGHSSEAHRLFCNMWNVHDKGDKDAYMSMLESLCSSGKMAEAIDLLNRFHEKCITTDTIMYNTVFTALGRLKQVSHIHDLYEKMKREGPPPDIFTYNILISSYGRAGRVDSAVKVFEELENSNCQPDVISYNSLINCLGKNGDVDEAHMRFKEMQEKGLNPDVVTYSTLIECFGKTDKVEMACSLFDEMIAEECSPNLVTYNILLDCLERSGRTAEAVDLYAKLKQQGLTPDSITYAVLERLQSGRHGKLRIRRQNPITGWVVSPLQ